MAWAQGQDVVAVGDDGCVIGAQIEAGDMAGQHARGALAGRDLDRLPIGGYQASCVLGVGLDFAQADQASVQPYLAQILIQLGRAWASGGAQGLLAIYPREEVEITKHGLA